MKPYRAAESARIDAPANVVYDILTDYHKGHPFILPKPYFVGLKIEKGGVGAGTIINFQMRVFGKTQTFRAAITEPEPGRVLVETNLDDAGAITTFVVDSHDQNQSCEVTIATDGRTRRWGLLGILERSLTISFLRRIYREELKLLAASAKDICRHEDARTNVDRVMIGKG